MSLKYKIASLDEVDASLQSYYTEKDGEFVLQLEGAPSAGDTTALQTALNKERLAHKTTKTKLEEYADIRSTGLSPTEILEKLDRYDELEAAAGDKIDEEKLEKMVETRIKTKLAPIQRENDQLKTKVGEYENKINEFVEKDRTRTIHDAVRKAATDAKVVPTAIDDILMVAERQFEIDESGKVVAKDGVGVTPGVDPTVYLTEMQQKRPHWWPQSQGGGASGGGNTGGGGSNPFSADGWNMTEQGRILRENPGRAEQLAKSAGTTVGGPRPVKK